MAQLRLLLIVCLAWFAVLFNIERIVLWNQQIINLDAAVYAVTILVGIALFCFPNLSRQSKWIIFAAMLVGYFASMGARDETLADKPVHTIAIDGVAMFTGLLLFRRVGRALLEFEMAVQNYVIDVKNSRLTPLMQGQEIALEELHRARRFERPVALLYCTVSAKIEDKDSQIVTDFIRWRITRSLRQRYCQVKIAEAAASLTYKSDTIMEYGSDVMILLPETSQQEAETFARRLSRFTREIAHLEPKIGLANFPTDGLVLDDLIECAKQRIRYWKDADDDQNNRNGDVIIDFEERLRIERSAMWTNKLAFQSQSARDIYGVLKRAMDITAVMLIMPMLLPVLALIALLIKLDDGGPIFYMQSRTGFKGQRFKMYKFRTMIPNAKAIPAEVIILPNGKKMYKWPDKTDRDPRITRIGRILRKTSLDEIPQILNVLKGDMSLVGPRPTTWELDKYTLHQTERLTVRPGITGLWQVSARDSTNMDERLLWDLKYIQKMSLYMDVQVLWRTVASVFEKKGA